MDHGETIQLTRYYIHGLKKENPDVTRVRLELCPVGECRQAQPAAASTHAVTCLTTCRAGDTGTGDHSWERTFGKFEVSQTQRRPLLATRAFSWLKAAVFALAFKNLMTLC